MIQYPCGCVNDVHEPSGILHCLVKCDYHRRFSREPARLDEAYYTELAKLDGHEFANSRHVEEIRDALGEFPVPTIEPQCLEIGCGASPYVGALKEAGWKYIGLDSSRWACEWTAKRYGVTCMSKSWEWWSPYPSFGLVLAAHVLEHLTDAPAGLKKMYEVLKPGGELWLIVPDESDPTNPDHLWFMNESTLERAVQKAGFVIERLVTKHVVPREGFIYCRAVKP